DICIANQGYLNEMLTRFAGELHELAALLQSGDETGLLEIFQRAKKARDRYVDGVNKS
ncbi:MAG: prephenate dehydrogenase/arogenate dehydrogenase family protein, partial [Candidatus Thiodiazotropha endolucinida]